MNPPTVHEPIDLQAWDARLESGDATLDLQHRVLFELVLRTRAASVSGLGLNLHDLLAQLRAYADYHFRYEEDWIGRRAVQPLTGWSHADLHADFRHQLGELEALQRQGLLGVGQLHDFLYHWLLDHIVQQDLPMIRALLRASTATA